MGFLAESLKEAARLILMRDPDVVSAVATSIQVSFWSVLLASAAGVPLGVALGISDLRCKRGVISFLNTLMAMPTVVIGLLVYCIISRQGPLGGLGLLFTPSAMVIGQTVLALPIIANYTVSTVRGSDPRIWETARTLGAGTLQCALKLVSETRIGIMAAVIAGFGRVVAEVGIAMMLGGNIRGYTRTMTTAIALETGKGEFAAGLALGAILMTVAMGINVLLAALQEK